MFFKVFSRVCLVICVVALSFYSPVEAQSRKGKWGFGDNRYFIIDQVCRDGMELSAINSSALTPPSFQSATPIDIGARLYANTAITLPVWSDESSRSPAADYGPQLAPLTVFTMTPEVDPLPADTNNDGGFTPGDEYFDVYMNGEFLLWTEILTPGARVIATHFSFNDSEELGYESLTVEDCYFSRLTAGKSAITTIGSSQISAGGSLQPSQVVYRLTRAPEHGSLRLNGTPLAVGGTFTQADVNAGLVTYQHNGDSATNDTFRFDMAGLALVSVNNSGTRGNGATNLTPSISGDGRKVAFYSDSTNLVAGDTNAQADIFVRDVLSGTTALVSVSITGTVANDFSFVFPALSDNGRYVAFASAASNLVNGDTNTCASHPISGHCPDIFVRDLQTNTTVRVSVSSANGQADGESANPAISADGRYVVFESAATNLVTGDTNDFKDIFLRDRDTDNDGIFDENGAVSTTRVSVATGGAQAVGGESFTPAISANGQIVAFGSLATNLVGSDNNAVTDVFVRDLGAGTTTRVSISSAGVQGNSFSSQPKLSADGRYVAFSSVANNLVSDDTNANCGGSFDQECGDVFVRDRQNNTTRRVSLSFSGKQIDFGYIDGVAISADGTRVWFTSRSGNVVFPDNNSTYDVFVHDWGAETTVRASTTVTEAEGNNQSYYADLSDDGQSVAFDSFAQLSPGDPASTQDVYVRYLGYSQTFTIALRHRIYLPVLGR